MRPISVIHLGHSHLAALTPVLEKRSCGRSGNGPPITHYAFNTSKYNIFSSGADKFYFGVKGEGGYRLNVQLLQLINATIPPQSEVVIATMFGGNTHNAITMLEVPGGLDLIVPDHEDLDLDYAANIIPYTLARDILEEQCKEYLNDLVATRAATSGLVFHVISPPPIADNAYISEMVIRDPYFSQMGHNRITPSIVRYKMWLLHSEIYISKCKELDIEVIFPPAGCIVEDRWLPADCIGLDPTHGNEIYGRRILEKLESLIGGHYVGWNWLG